MFYSVAPIPVHGIEHKLELKSESAQGHHETVWPSSISSALEGVADINWFAVQGLAEMSRDGSGDLFWVAQRRHMLGAWNYHIIAVWNFAMKQLGNSAVRFGRLFAANDERRYGDAPAILQRR